MTVVVVEVGPAHRTAELEPAVDAGEPGERGDRHVDGGADRLRDRHRRRGVQQVVRAIHGQPELVGRSLRDQRRGRAARTDRVDVQPDVGVRMRAVRRDRPARRSHRAHRGRVVGADDDVLAPFGERDERALDLREPAAVEVDVIQLDVGDDADRRTAKQERSVALVGLGDEQVARTRVGAAARLRSCPRRSRTSGRAPRVRATRAIIAVVVVLPCVPATAISRRSVAAAASACALAHVGIPRRRASTSSGLSSRIALETTTASASPRLVSAWPVATVAPSARSSWTPSESFRSEPVTSTPRARNSRARFRMPAPPMPIMCTRRTAPRSGTSSVGIDPGGGR